jgi:hypothetical protein
VKKRTLMNPFRALLAFLLLGPAMPAFAQTCAVPITIPTIGAFNGNTCTSTNQLPYLANGAIAVIGNEDVYHLTAANANSIVLTAQPEAALDLALFVCRNQCSTYATCIAAVDAGGAGAAESTQLPDGPGDYYVIVGTANPATPICGSYTLIVAGPLGKNPR